MDFELRPHAFSTVGRCVLAGGESMCVNPTAIRAHSAGITVQPKVEPKSGRRSFREVVRDGPPLPPRPTVGLTAVAPVQGGWLELVPALPGDVRSLPVDSDHSYFVDRRSWLGHSAQINLAEQRSADGVVTRGYDFALGPTPGMNVQGNGRVVVGAFGGCEAVDLEPEEILVVDTAYVIACDLATKHTLQRIPTKGALPWDNPVPGVSGRDKVLAEFTGPGQVVLQLRSPQVAADWVRSVVPPYVPD
jgi:uncharacterized protein (AIM24 family)